MQYKSWDMEKSTAKNSDQIVKMMFVGIFLKE